MAQRTQIVLTDDLDGSELEDGGTVTFSHMGVDYEIDLSDKNALKLDKALAPFVNAGRRTGGRRTRGTAAVTAPEAKEDLAAIRQWARDNGYEVSTRGRVSQDIKDAFHKTN